MTKTHHDVQYLDLLGYVLEKGVQKGDRTGTGTISTFAQQMRFDLTDYRIPLLTTKKMFTRGAIHEILWYLQGGTNTKYLKDNNVTIWDEWADEDGSLGPIYGYQWRKWEAFQLIKEHAAGHEWVPSHYEIQHIDQVADVISKLRNTPNDRRIIISAWNVADLPKMKLPPCHAFFQFWSRELSLEERNTVFINNVHEAHYDCPISIEEKSAYFDRHHVPKRALRCHLYQRSCDLFLGVPFNIVQYSILTHMIAHVTGHVAEEFVWTGGDVHLYNNHLDQAKLQLTRQPYESPTLKLNPSVKQIDDFKFEDFEIIGYTSHPPIKGEVSI